MKKLSLNTKLAAIILGVISVALLTHLTPEWAVRANLFSSGHFKEAFSSKIEQVESKEKASFDYATFFKVSPPPLEKSTHAYLETYEVKSIAGLFHSAQYFGEV
ncbi:hypothetical protein [Candidatus Enterococcus clewellii]|uniref:Uncharacterized protein n=1 Tax=Candidatus Enterococcus clewellii TaxID=1834193 RepID=A0A242JZM0_9ENTE|nr:hypothetical protein [Enterococcus sp. 9E7_DIV0242]OTP10571.1 hypothetical protein A5888_003869 [Enterococcus sp. 9E7_DIV0242]